MRTTINIPESLLIKAQKILKTSLKSETVTEALKGIIRSYERRQLLSYKGKIDLDIDLDILRDRK
jgi:Arc/MetJ family transcription regulator